MNVTCEQSGDVVIVHAGPARLMHPSLSEFSTLVTGEIARGTRKIVINFKTIAGSPQVTQIFSDWDVVSPISDSVFTFVPPDGANKIVVNPKKSEDATDGVPTEAPAKK